MYDASLVYRKILSLTKRKTNVANPVEEETMRVCDHDP